MEPIDVEQRKLVRSSTGSFYISLPKWWVRVNARHAKGADKVHLLIFEDFAIVTLKDPSEILAKLRGGQHGNRRGREEGRKALPDDVKR